jgi:oxygen-dependent protoporphyrinogen oxidase
MRTSSDTRKIAVIGGGISGLAAAHFVRKIAFTLGRTVQVDLFEGEDRAGGKFAARVESGFIVEAGPNGFLDSKPWTLDLVRDLGMEKELLPSDQAAARRFIYSRGRLHELKAPPAFLLSSLLSWRARIGMGRELFAHITPPGIDTTLAEFGTRRLGSEVVERLLDPMVSGIFAGDPHQMSLRASFPRIAELEEQYGGLIKAWMSLSRERRAAKKRGEEAGISAGPSGPGGVLTSFRKGVSQVTDRLASDMGDHLHTGRPIVRLDASGERLRLVSDGEVSEADGVILATPADRAADILSQSAPRSSALLSKIPYSPMAVVGVGYDLEDLREPPNGFGFLIPRVEKRKILGALWTSSIFPGHRSPEGKFLIRVMVGGARDHETPFLPDGELLDTVKGELAATMGLAAEPSFFTIIRWKEAIPLYTVGHLDRVAEAERELPHGVVLAGNAYRGVGINDCVREAEVAAEKVLAALSQS